MLAATSIAPQVTQNKLVDQLYVTYNGLTNTRLNENTTHGLLLQVIRNFSPGINFFLLNSFGLFYGYNFRFRCLV